MEPVHLGANLEALPGEWLRVEAADASDLRRELRREMPPGHPLEAQQIQPFARRVRRDDVVWWLPHTRAWAWVHLSYQAETDARWPSCAVYPTWEALVEDLDEE